MLTYQMPVGVAGLPAKEKRDELEELSWEGIQEAIKFAEAQEDPELRLLRARNKVRLMFRNSEKHARHGLSLSSFGTLSRVFKSKHYC
jgi:hypothetical protein